MIRVIQVVWATVLGVVVVCGCGGSAAVSARPTVTAPADTRLGPGDTFEITVYEEKDLSGKFQVADDGTINFPLIGAVQVAGKGPSELAHELQEALTQRHILRAPNVAIFVTESASKRITVVGAVSRPGSYPATNGLTAVQAISLAGGITALASANDTLVTRKVDGKLERYKVAVRSVTEGRADDLPLQPGDIVYVPERLF